MANAAAAKVCAVLNLFSAFVALSVLVGVTVRLCYGFLLLENLSAAVAMAAFGKSGLVAGCRNGRVNDLVVAEGVNCSRLRFVAACAGEGFAALLGAGRRLGNNPFAAPIVAESLNDFALLCCSAF